MITKLDIKGFKCFENLSVSKLTRINLVSGKNNSGKTSLLEAVFLFYDRINPQMITNQFARRGVPILPLDPDTIWAPIFRDYEMVKEISIEVTSDNLIETMKIIFNPSYIPPSIQAIQSSKGTQGLQIRTDQKPTPSYSLDIDYSRTNGMIDKSHSFIKDGFLNLHFDQMQVGKTKATIIPSRSFSNPKEEANKFGNLDVEGKLDKVLEFLRIIEPKLQSISAVPIGNTSIIHGDIGLKRKLPISYMGEGVAKLLTIIVDIANSRNGIVLIDEFENGFHYSVLQKIWEGLLLAAKEFDCQIIATTHSHECLVAAYDAFKNDSREDFTYLRLDRINNETKTKVFDFSMLETAINTNLEVR
jgi:AAA15 family ATPase/GTPase